MQLGFAQENRTNKVIQTLRGVNAQEPGKIWV